MEGKKDILVLIDSFDPDYFGGAARVFRETCKILMSDGYKIQAICRMPENKTPPDDVADFKVYHDIDGGSSKKISHYRNSIKRLLSASLAERSPDAVILHSSSAALGCLEILKNTSAPIIYYFHSPWSREHELKRNYTDMSILNPLRGMVAIESLIRRRHEKKYLATSDGIVTLSEYMATEMLKIHGAETLSGIPRRVIPGGVDVNTFRPAASDAEKREIRGKLSLPENSFIVISSRRMVPRTGLDLLIKAFGQLPADLAENAVLVLTGDGPSMPDLKRLATESEASERVLFTGHVPEPVLAEYYRCSDLFVMPTRELEGFGLSTVEAMASGLPAIGTNVGGTPEILSRISRDLIIPEATPKAISAKLAQFMKKQNLTELRERSLRAVGQHHTWSAHADALLEFLKSTPKLL